MIVGLALRIADNIKMIERFSLCVKNHNFFFTENFFDDTSIDVLVEKILPFNPTIKYDFTILNENEIDYILMELEKKSFLDNVFSSRIMYILRTIDMKSYPYKIDSLRNAQPITNEEFIFSL